MKYIVKISSIAVLSIIVLGLSGCIKTSGYGVKKSPPSHAPAYGRRAQDVIFYNYTYYPLYGIYYDPIRRVYFYQSNKGWITAKKLPSRFRKPGRSVKIKVDNKKPYLKHKEHKQKFAKGKKNKKEKVKSDNSKGKGNSSSSKGKDKDKGRQRQRQVKIGSRQNNLIENKILL